MTKVERKDNMRKLLKKSVSSVLVLAMMFSLFSVSAFAKANIKINDINNNIVKINSYFLNIKPTANILQEKGILKILFN